MMSCRSTKAGETCIGQGRRVLRRLNNLWHLCPVPVCEPGWRSPRGLSADPIWSWPWLWISRGESRTPRWTFLFLSVKAAFPPNAKTLSLPTQCLLYAYSASRQRLVFHYAQGDTMHRPAYPTPLVEPTQPGPSIMDGGPTGGWSRVNPSEAWLGLSRREIKGHGVGQLL